MEHGDFYHLYGTHGNNLKVSMCTNSSAFSSTATSLVNNGSGIVGATTVDIDNGSEFVVGDLLEFGDASSNFSLNKRRVLKYGNRHK